VETVVGELAANAYVHARSPFTVSLYCHDQRISVEVEDQSSVMPAISAPAGVDLGGRGLVMVRAIAATWGARPVDVGKVVWAEMVARAAFR
jgi:anti-sigma regulatory factor (Ser/Thr protein kinase)